MSIRQDETSDRDALYRGFVRLLAQHELQLAGYVHSLVPMWNDAEDILQETKLRLWDQFEQFRPNEDFAGWAFTIAGYMVLAYRKQHQRRKVCFGDEVLEKLAARAQATAGTQDDRAAALVECLRSVSESGRNLLRRFYDDRCSVKEIAEEVGQSTTATYQAISRIRRSLQGCIERRLRKEAW